MATASLPDLPKGREFEDLVAAIYQSSGLFVERDVTQREEIDLLQLDVITTDYGQAPPALRLVEAKSGNWGFGDIFKMRGWMAHLNVEASTLVTLQDRDRFDAYQRLADKCGVGLLRVPDAASAAQHLLEGKVVSDIDVETWRFCYWVERRLIECVRAQRAGDRAAARFKQILDHAFEITSNVFFSESVAERVEMLYGTYARYRNLTARCAMEMETGTFGDDDATIPGHVFEDAFYRCRLTELHAACFMEHKARLTLLKAAVDYLSYLADGQAKALFK